MSGNSLVLWILLAAVLLALVAKLYGWKGVLSVAGLGGALLAKDAIRRSWGHTAEWIFVGLFAILCIALYLIRHRKRDRHGRNKHDLESGHDPVA